MIKNLKPGSILSESAFYRVKSVNSNNTVTFLNDGNDEITIGNTYVEKLLSSADYFEKEEKKNMTELAELLIGSSRIAMTVAFFKKDVEKTQRAYKLEKEAKITEIQNAKVGDIPGLLNDLIENPISRTTPGELRVMKGRHYGAMDELGRIQFVDMEITSGMNIRQIDPRTIQWLVVNKIKYNLK